MKLDLFGFSGLSCQLPALYKDWLFVLCMAETDIVDYGFGTSIKVAFLPPPRRHLCLY